MPAGQLCLLAQLYLGQIFRWRDGVLTQSINVEPTGTIEGVWRPSSALCFVTASGNESPNPPNDVFQSRDPGATKPHWRRILITPAESQRSPARRRPCASPRRRTEGSSSPEQLLGAAADPHTSAVTAPGMTRLTRLSVRGDKSDLTGSLAVAPIINGRSRRPAATVLPSAERGSSRAMGNESGRSVIGGGDRVPGPYSARLKHISKGAHMRAARQRLSYANVAATAALFLALGGGAYAATNLPANSVGTKQIKNKAVTLAKLAPAAQKALGKPGPRGATGSQGPKGDSGVQGAKGDTGSVGPLGPAFVKVVTNSGPNAFPSSAPTTLATADLSTSAPASYLATATFDVTLISGYITCVLSSYGSANAANDETGFTSPNQLGEHRLTLQVPVVAPAGGTYGVTLSCLGGGGFSADHQFVTLSAIQTSKLSLN